MLSACIFVHTSRLQHRHVVTIEFSQCLDIYATKNFPPINSCCMMSVELCSCVRSAALEKSWPNAKAKQEIIIKITGQGHTAHWGTVRNKMSPGNKVYLRLLRFRLRHACTTAVYIYILYIYKYIIIYIIYIHIYILL